MSGCVSFPSRSCALHFEKKQAFEKAFECVCCECSVYSSGCFILITEGIIGKDEYGKRYRTGIAARVALMHANTYHFQTPYDSLTPVSGFKGAMMRLPKVYAGLQRGFLQCSMLADL